MTIHTETPKDSSKVVRIAVQGWCSDTAEAPVIINPSASQAALTAWALGQLKQANVLMTIIGSGSCAAIAPAECINAVKHFLEQAEVVLSEAVERG